MALFFRRRRPAVNADERNDHRDGAAADAVVADPTAAALPSGMASDPAFRLFGETMWTSPYVFSSFVALTEKGVPFEVVEVALAAGAHLEEGYRDISLTARVPSLEHDGFHLAESGAIAEYLEEVLPPPAHPRLFPADVQQRARARQVMGWLRSDLSALREDRSTVTMFFPFDLRPLRPAAERDSRKLIRIAEQLIPGSGDNLFGAWCLADSELAFMLHRLILTGEPVPARLRGYAEAQWRRPAVRSFVDHPRPGGVPESYWGFTGTPRPG
jgi:glutathione S-transferase